MPIVRHKTQSHTHTDTFKSPLDTRIILTRMTRPTPSRAPLLHLTRRINRPRNLALALDNLGREARASMPGTKNPKSVQHSLS